MKDLIFKNLDLKPVHASLELVDDCARVSKIEKLDQDDSNTFIMINDFKLKNGVIEVDVCGKLREDAPSHARGFIGLVFRSKDDTSEFESFYIRPTNGKGCDDPVRRSHGCQYFAYPGYDFKYFREFGVTDYENEVPTIELGKWAHIKVILQDEKLECYVDGNPILTVRPMLHKPIVGKIGLYTDIGTDGYFKNLKVEIRD